MLVDTRTAIESTVFATSGGVRDCCDKRTCQHYGFYLCANPPHLVVNNGVSPRITGSQVNRIRWITIGTSGHGRGTCDDATKTLVVRFVPRKKNCF